MSCVWKTSWPILNPRKTRWCFPRGYQANVGTISAMARPADAVFIDRLAHASIVGRISGWRDAGCAPFDTTIGPSGKPV
jgi:hypothetical protein